MKQSSKKVHTSQYDGMDRRDTVDTIDWHQTKGLSLSIIILLVVNIVSTVWWAATLTNDVTQIKARPDLTERVIKLEAVSDEYKTILGRINYTLNNMNSTISRIDRSQAEHVGVHKNGFKKR